MAMLRPASEMKDSGIEWVGQIPQNWNKNKLRYLVRLINGYPFQSSLYSNEGVFIVRITNVDDGCLNTNNPRYYPEQLIDEYSNSLLKSKDILMTLTGNVGLVGIVDEGYPKSALNQRVGCIRVSSPLIIHKYLYYLFMTQEFTETATLYSKGTVQLNMSTEWLLNERIPLPDISEQQAIADYLDDRCSKIDEIIAEATASIEEYKELKQAVIFEAVTKGLDKNTPTKDSKMEFAGDIPAHWQVVRFIRTNWVRGRLGWKGLKADEYVDNGYPFLSAFNIINSHLAWTDLNHITQERYDESPEIKLSVGDIVLVKDGAGIGKCARIDELPLGEATVNSSLAVITPQENIYYRYEYYYFLSPLFQNIITRLRNGMGVPHLTQESMKAIYMPLPTIEEQKAISDYLDVRVGELDDLISEKQALIDDLQAYKKSLIYEVVTGKRRVV